MNAVVDTGAGAGANTNNTNPVLVSGVLPPPRATNPLATINSASGGGGGSANPSLKANAGTLEGFLKSADIAARSTLNNTPVKSNTPLQQHAQMLGPGSPSIAHTPAGALLTSSLLISAPTTLTPPSHLLTMFYLLQGAYVTASPPLLYLLYLPSSRTRPGARRFSQ